MRIWLGRVIYGLGGFLLAAGLLGLIWAPGAVKKTPIDVDTTTYLDGTAAKIDVSTGELVSNPIVAISVTKSDTGASDGDTVAWVQSSCVMIDRGGDPECVDGSDDMITASVDVFATDRVTALATNDAALPPDAVPHDGLVNKWPFDAQKKTYPYWNGTVGRAVDAVYDRTEDIDGTEVYVYRTTVTDEPIEVAEDTPGTYTDTTEIYVEPQTGAILNQTDDQQRYLEDGTQVLDLQLAFTTDQVATSVSDNRSDVASLRLLTVTVPLVGLIGGPLLIAIGLALALSGRRDRKAGTASGRPSRKVGAGV